MRRVTEPPYSRSLMNAFRSQVSLKYLMTAFKGCSPSAHISRTIQPRTAKMLNQFIHRYFIIYHIRPVKPPSLSVARALRQDFVPLFTSIWRLLQDNVLFSRTSVKVGLPALHRNPESPESSGKSQTRLLFAANQQTL